MSELDDRLELAVAIALEAIASRRRAQATRLAARSFQRKKGPPVSNGISIPSTVRSRSLEVSRCLE